jgi:predicted GH43/DUF377 family glycosyl hydrolase
MSIWSSRRTTLTKRNLSWAKNADYQRLRGLTLSINVRGLVLSKRRLIKAGQFGGKTACSIINPGALYTNNQFHLLCRGEPNDSTWLGNWSESQATPVWCVLDGDFITRNSFLLQYKNLPQGQRPEDWRLFQFNGQIYSNHSIYMENGGSLGCRSGISIIDLENHEIKSCLTLVPPFKASNEEKNWSMFIHEEKILCIYSFDPYVVLRVNLLNSKTEIVINGGSCLFDWIEKASQFIGISTNPISWDEKNYIIFIHDYIEPDLSEQRNRVYMQYAALLDKITLMPSSVVPFPLLIGGQEQGRHPGVHYTMSLVNKDNKLYAFFGEGDTHCGVVIFDNKILSEIFNKHKCQESL